jgi:ATP-binding cassette subfamily B protein
LDRRNVEREEFPEAWRAALEARVEPGERVLDWFQPDLDRQLRYDDGLVVLTDRRVLLGEARAEEGLDRSWPLAAVASLRVRERSGLGTLDVLGASGRLDGCRFTIRRASAVHRFVESLQSLRRGAPVGVEASTASPGALEAEAEAVPAAADPGARGWAGLFRSDAPFIRLLRFARPRLAIVAVGFVLSLASTAANLVWPYLTMTLMDNILIPHQEWVEHRAGPPVDFGPARWYLQGFAH